MAKSKVDTRHTSCEVINIRVLVQHSFVSHKIRINKKNNYKQSSNVQNIPRYDGFFKMFQITFVFFQQCHPFQVQKETRICLKTFSFAHA